MVFFCQINNFERSWLDGGALINVKAQDVVRQWFGLEFGLFPMTFKVILMSIKLK